MGADRVGGDIPVGAVDHALGGLSGHLGQPGIRVEGREDDRTLSVESPHRLRRPRPCPRRTPPSRLLWVSEFDRLVTISRSTLPSDNSAQVANTRMRQRAAVSIVSAATATTSFTGSGPSTAVAPGYTALSATSPCAPSIIAHAPSAWWPGGHVTLTNLRCDESLTLAASTRSMFTVGAAAATSDVADAAARAKAHITPKRQILIADLHTGRRDTHHY